MIELYDHQREAITKMKNGCILCGGVGTGKSRTALAYYYQLNGGDINDETIPMDDPPKDLYIMTTARKRDQLEWVKEMAPFLMSPSETSLYSNKIVVDSWNNIRKYKDVKNAFFIFDEQRVIGKGAWVKAFLNIAKFNEWILLSATPGDTWSDYIPVFIANGFYRNRTDFSRQHIVWNPRTNFPKIDRYVGTGKLIKERRAILVTMKYERSTISHHIDVPVEYDKTMYKLIFSQRKDIYDDNKPIKNAGKLCYILRKLIDSDESRLQAVLGIYKEHPKVIIFYNHTFELELLKSLDYGEGVEIAEYNGQKHEDLPEGDKWVYLVQYAAGSEAWNCIETDTIIFYSQNYSYRTMEQSAGRIDRLNTSYKDLYYYHLKSWSPMDIVIARALKNKKTFNESMWLKQNPQK